jgi:hypothetical protein
VVADSLVPIRLDDQYNSDSKEPKGKAGSLEEEDLDPDPISIDQFQDIVRR